MKKKGLLFFSTAAVALTLAACGGKGQSSNSTTTGGTPQPKTKYASEVTHDGTPIKGGTLKYAMVSAAPFKGLYAIYQEQPEGFVEKYQELLRATTVSSVEDTAKVLGVDVSTPEFWKKALAEVAESIEAFIALTPLNK